MERKKYPYLRISIIDNMEDNLLKEWIDSLI
jgi:hypothetical protein